MLISPDCPASARLSRSVVSGCFFISLLAGSQNLKRVPFASQQKSPQCESNVGLEAEWPRLTAQIEEAASEPTRHEIGFGYAAF